MQSPDIVEPTAPTPEPELPPADAGAVPDAPDTAVADAVSEPAPAEAEPAPGLPAEEAISQAAAATAPKDQPLPGFEPPPFNFEEALHKIATKNRAVARAKSEWEAAKEEAASLKKIYDREVESLSALIRDCDERERTSTPRLVRPVPEASPGAGCVWERREQEPCPLCRMLRAYGCPMPAADDTDHAAAVDDALEKATDPAVLVGWIFEACSQVLALEVIQGWTESDRGQVAVYCAAVTSLPSTGNVPKRPEVLGTPHVADAPGDHVQSCRVCGRVLVDLSKADARPVEESVLIGTDCEPPEAVDETRDADDETIDVPADTDGADGETDAVGDETDAVMAANKVCLCETPNPGTVAGRCDSCLGTITGTPATPKKARKR